MGLVIETSVKLSVLEVCVFVKVRAESYHRVPGVGNHYVLLDSFDWGILGNAITYLMASWWFVSRRRRNYAGLTLSKSTWLIPVPVMKK